MNYELILLPFVTSDFKNLSKKEAIEYFEYYVSQKQLRITKLFDYIIQTNAISIKCDYSPESLIPLWEWYENRIEVASVETITLNRLEFETYLKWMDDEFFSSKLSSINQSVSKNTEIFSKFTLSLCIDISMYFAEVIIRNNPSIYWGYFNTPKNRFSVNRPVLLGFAYKKALDPRLVVLNCTRRSNEEKDTHRLYVTYNEWLCFIKE